MSEWVVERRVSMHAVTWGSTWKGGPHWKERLAKKLPLDSVFETKAEAEAHAAEHNEMLAIWNDGNDPAAYRRGHGAPSGDE